MVIRSVLKILVLATAASQLSGCFGLMPGKSDNTVFSDDWQVLTSDSRLRSGASMRLDNALQLSETGQALRAVDEFETLLGDYEGTDARFAIAVRTAIALEYLNLGYRNDFLNTAQTLEAGIPDNTRIGPETQYVLVLAAAMSGKGAGALPGREHDPRLSGVIADLLATDNQGVDYGISQR